MLLAWWALPVLALSIFLLLSILHFGDQDASGHASNRLIRVVAYGGVPIIVSAACHPSVIERLLAGLVPGRAHMVTMLLGGPLMLLWIAAAGETFVADAVPGQADDWTAAVELILVTQLFAVATPLIAFSLYFAGTHAPRVPTAATPAEGLRTGEMVMPLVLTSLGIRLVAAIFFTGPETPIGETVVRSSFLLLSALTVPHMGLEWRARLASGVPTVAP